jgi:hypothetical protein
VNSLDSATSSDGEEGNRPPTWDKLIARAATESDPRLRRAAVRALGSQPSASIVAHISPLLADEDPETRSEAAVTLLSLLGSQPRRAVASQSQFIPDFDLPGMRTTTGAKTNPPPYSASDKLRWHSSLLEKAGAAPDIFVAGALFATGTNAASDLPLLVSALQSLKGTNAQEFARSGALGAILPSLPWPAGKPLADRLCASPALFLASLQAIDKCGKDLRAYLLDPARFLAAVDPATMDLVGPQIPRLLNQARAGYWTLLAPTPENERIVKRLSQATNPVWKAVSVYVLGQQGGQANPDIFQREAHNTNSWVRLAAVTALARQSTTRADLETKIVPFLSDKDTKVLGAAVSWLLEPETRSAAGLSYANNYFIYEGLMAGSYESMEEPEQRPMAPLDSKPGFLAGIRERLKDASLEDMKAFSLLLAQYGDNSGLDLLLEKHAGAGRETELDATVLAAIALTRNPKYIPTIRKMQANAQQEWDYRRILQAVKGVNGPEARALRMDINRRLRSGVVEEER